MSVSLGMLNKFNNPTDDPFVIWGGDDRYVMGPPFPAKSIPYSGMKGADE